MPRGEVKIDGRGGGDGEVRKMLYNNDRDDYDTDDLDNDIIRDEVERVFKRHPHDYISKLEELGFEYYDDDEEDIEEQEDGSTVITFTDIHLPRGVGEAIEQAYKGELDIHYTEEAGIVRVYWKR